MSAFLKRESLQSTALIRGLASPRIRHASADRVIGTIAISRAGAAFESLDGEPTNLFFVYISPWDLPGDHLRAGMAIDLALRNDSFVSSLREATTSAAIWETIQRLG